MKKLFIVAALLMASTAAHAGNSISFEIDGQKIHIEAPKNCDQLSCIQITAPGLSGSSFGFKSFKSGTTTTMSRTLRSARAGAAPAVAAGRAAAVSAVDAGGGCAERACAGGQGRHHHDRSAAIVHRPRRRRRPLLAAAPVHAAPRAGRRRTRVGADHAARRLGHRRKQGQCSHRAMRPEPLRLCRTTGEKILINMKPQDSKWTGQIHDPDSGRNYDSTIAMKGANTLKVQGCAFGGMFCGGQTWKRIS